jgi:Ca2+-dependent lipid-binding protein
MAQKLNQVKATE